MNQIKTINRLAIFLLFAGLAFVLLLLPKTTRAQELDRPYTGPNDVTLTLPGTSITYSYYSNQLLIRVDQEARKLELRIPVLSFVPANTGSPQVLLREIFLADAHPDMVILLDAPLDLLFTEQTQPDTRVLQGVLIAQGVSRDIQTELHIVPLPNQATLSALIRFSVTPPNVAIPSTYAPMIQGVAELVFQNARWLNPNPIDK